MSIVRSWEDRELEAAEASSLYSNAFFSAADVFRDYARQYPELSESFLKEAKKLEAVGNEHKRRADEIFDQYSSLD